MPADKYKVIKQQKNDIKTSSRPSDSKTSMNGNQKSNSKTASTKTKKVIIVILTGLILIFLLLIFDLDDSKRAQIDTNIQNDPDTEVQQVENPEGENPEIPETLTFPSQLDLQRIQKYPNHRVYVYDWDHDKLNFDGSTTNYKYKVSTQDISVHSEWNYKFVTSGYDIAVLRVEREDDHTDTIPIASMSDFSNLNRCDFFTVYGTGLTQHNQYSVEELLKTDLQQYINCNELNFWKDYNHGVLTNIFLDLAPGFNSAICTNATVEQQTQLHNGNNQNDPSVPCTGDSGGPLVKDGKLFGMVSYTYSAPPCVTGPFATIFTSAANYIENDWLKVHSDNDLMEDSSVADLPVTTCH